jgi:putative transposase
MREQPFLRRRRSVRLPLLDYAQPARYFVTVCVQDMRPLFGKVVRNEVVFTEAGRIAEECWRSIPERFADVELGPHVIMPDHVHGVVIIRPPASEEPDAEFSAAADGENVAKHPRRARYIVPLRPQNPVREFGTSVAGSIATIVATSKAGVSREIGRRFDRKLARSIWQRGFYEPVIRDDDDFGKVCEYIRTNPIRRTFKNEFQSKHIEKTKRSKA